MSFFKKLIQNIKGIGQPQQESDEASVDPGNLSIDELFVRNFIKKGGKFLYCTSMEEVEQSLLNVLQENKWNNVVFFDKELDPLLNRVNTARTNKIIHNLPFFTRCEALIAEDGSTMFSSKQLKGKKLKDLPENFIVYAKTSQLARSIREGVMAVRMRTEVNTPTIVSSVKDYSPRKTDTDFLSYGNTNAKSLYLLLLEDL